MSDGLLLTRKERLQRFEARFGAGLGPSLALVAAAFAHRRKTLPNSLALAGLAPREPEAHGLVALMELQASRAAARLGVRRRGGGLAADWGRRSPPSPAGCAARGGGPAPSPPPPPPPPPHFPAGGPGSPPPGAARVIRPPH